MKELIGKVVRITEVSYELAWRDQVLYEFQHEGRVEKVEGNMIKLVDCRRIHQLYGDQKPITCWFNTLAGTLKFIEVGR